MRLCRVNKHSQAGASCWKRLPAPTPCACLMLDLVPGRPFPWLGQFAQAQSERSGVAAELVWVEGVSGTVSLEAVEHEVGCTFL